MSRLLLLSVLILWMCPRDNVRPLLAAAPALLIFLGAYLLLVLGMSLWSRKLAGRVADGDFGRTLDRYNRAAEMARYFIPTWFAIGIFALGWGRVVYELLMFMEPAVPRHAEAKFITETYWRVPGLLLGIMPAVLAWMGLWWAQYPADRALKEQSVLYRADEGLPIHAPPPLATFFVEHFRQQVLFTLSPVFLIVLARDLMALGWWIFGDKPMSRDGGDWLIIPLSLMIFVFAPEMLRRMIPTAPLPHEWPLRRRLEALCDRAGLKCRDILLWKTNSSVGNAMVMGLFPRVRYIFLSDLLLETMRDEEIEAVFAHEIGHIVHRHMWWYLVFILMLMLLMAGPLTLILALVPWLAHNIDLQVQVSTVLGLGIFAILFGFFSRRFERQADVYAARTMESVRRAGGDIMMRHFNPQAAAELIKTASLAPALQGPADLRLDYSPAPSYVGEYGASVVASALHRVARVNNMPVAANEWLHGSIQMRMQYLQDLAVDQSMTHKFDRYMRRLYWSMTGLLVALGTWFCMQYGLTGIVG